MTRKPLPTASAHLRRLDAIDVARGMAICAMVAYHFSWDLSFLRLIATNILEVPAWRWFARTIAASFLFLVGVGLVLAQAKCLHTRGLALKPFLVRLAKIAAAALAVTAVSYLAFPQGYIFFGILHCIAASSVLAVPFLRMPVPATLAAAVLCFLMPSIAVSPALDAPWLAWLGLGIETPVTNDYVPIFPWFGWVLLGLGAAQATSGLGAADRLASWRAKAAPARALVWAGRRSLPIYLLHQAVLLAALYGLLQITGPNPKAVARPFLAECEATCRQQNGQPDLCRTTCSCIVETARPTDLWQKIVDNAVGPEDQIRLSRAAQQCLRRSP